LLLHLLTISITVSQLDCFVDFFTNIVTESKEFYKIFFTNKKSR